MGENAKDKEKCFVIMPISDQGDYPQGHFTKVYEQIIKPAVEDAGYLPYRVDENKISDTIINKIFDAVQECPMAVCDLSNRNPNVLYELGLRQAYDKPVVLIQDDKTEKIFDVSGISTVFYNSSRLYEDVIAARKNIKNAIISTRNDKMNTLVRIVKAKTPDLSQIDLTQDDRIKVVLDGIYNEIRLVNSNRNKGVIHSDNSINIAYDYEDALLMVEREMAGRCEWNASSILFWINKVNSIKEEIKKDENLSLGHKSFLLERADLLKSDLIKINQQ